MNFRNKLACLILELFGIKLRYVCRFVSADNTNKSQGKCLWVEYSMVDSIPRWKRTVGEEYDKGTFRLTIEAGISEADAVPRNRKPSNQIDWVESQAVASGLSAGVPDAQTGRSEDQG